MALSGWVPDLIVSEILKLILVVDELDSYESHQQSRTTLTLPRWLPFPISRIAFEQKPKLIESSLDEFQTNLIFPILDTNILELV